MNHWRIDEIERKANESSRRLYELDQLRSDVDRLRNSNRELQSKVDQLLNDAERSRYEFENFKNQTEINIQLIAEKTGVEIE